ncbi:YhgE/Pip domain-containing protein [Bifidobacterium catulorum]|uniref:YhgE/Pip domain-containing protein n=1 Tax=Bifidobacterium catulorum TaxID=1630173 RepID=A0A2U2MT69_9BIFI|nr:YhgE/Pip domain-containing protein [Bifidobacterium catulorum]PWG60022.1 YhgE/Pip domain-containing protein [Bifidobacterium catulorum]
MSTIWKLFTGDIRRMTSNVVSVIIIIGLVALPSLFTWFNVTAAWDPFSNTRNVKFAVANTDEGYKSDLVPLKVNVGDQVVSELRANDQLDWTFTTEDDAIDGTKSGKYYAAVVIPKSFSKDMMTFFSSDVEHAKLTYYTNEKKNALAPQLTGQGADQVAARINLLFATTLSNVALNIVSSLSNYIDDADTKSSIANLAGHIGELADQLAGAADTVDTYASLTDSARSLIDNSSKLLRQASGSAKDAGKTIDDTKQAGATIGDALKASTGGLSTALQSSAGSYKAVSTSIDDVYADIGKQTKDNADALRHQASTIDDQIAEYQRISKELQTLRGDLTTDVAKQAVDRITTKIDAIVTVQTTLRNKLDSAADSIEAGNATAQKDRGEITKLAQQADASISGLKTDFDTKLKPQINALADDVAESTALLKASASDLDSSVNDLANSSNSAGVKLGNVRKTLTAAGTEMTDAANTLKSLAKNITSALNSGDSSMLKKVLSGDEESLAKSLAAPVGVTRKALFPSENFGSSLSPFYTFLPLWVGSLLMAVTLKTSVSRRIRAELGPKAMPHQLYLGRFGIFAVLSLLQSSFVLLGNLLFLRVQVEHPWLYMLSGWASGLVFIFMIYTLVVSFGNVGKAIGVLFLVVQISGSGGAYPLAVMPKFFSDISPFLPITHSINAMRAAMFGIYDNDYWLQIGALLLFILPTLLLGLVLRKPLVKFNKWYVSTIESTKLL